MKIVIAGGSGFLGKAFIRHAGKEHEIILLSRGPAKANPDPGEQVRTVQWDGMSQGPWEEYLEGAEAVVNLAGASIGARRWTQAEKNRLLGSRLNATRALVDAIRRAGTKPRVLVSVSGVGYYGNVESGDVTEASPNGSDFLARLCGRWEHEALAAAQSGVRVVIPRFGLVLGREGGAFPRMALPFRLFAGGVLGSGRQWFPWIHVDDAARILHFAIRTENATGPLNGAAPEAATMRDFCRELGRSLHRPVWAPVPAAALRILLGEMADMLMTGQKAVPGKLLEYGFTFQYPALRPALASLAGPEPSRQPA